MNEVKKENKIPYNFIKRYDMENEKLEEALKEFNKLSEYDKNAFKKKIMKPIPITGPSDETSPYALIDYFRKKIGFEPVEHIMVVYFSGINCDIVKVVELAKGATLSTPFSIKELVRQGLACDASSVWVIHNHPTGLIRPSVEDLDNAKLINAVCNMFEFPLDEFLIVGPTDEYYSFHENNLLKKGELSEKFYDMFCTPFAAAQLIKNPNFIKLMEDITGETIDELTGKKKINEE